jgi:alginate O-acetyltransferase complex protein AlgI
MLFSQPVFFAFFLIYFLAHCLVPQRARVYLIIIGSAVFYSWWNVRYVGLPFGLGFLAWGGVLWMETDSGGLGRRCRLAMVILVLLLPLAAVKYAYFFVNDILGAWVDWRGLFDVRQLKWQLPLGISFVTFTLIAYVVDVYRRKYRPQRNLATVLAYVLFFPHLIAGPILRPHEFMPQLRVLRKALDARFTLGIAIFTLGFVKKVVFADQLGEMVDQFYATQIAQSGWEYLIVIYGFSVQIYCDFSGYTDMAIGLAYLLRIRLPTNFLRPYTSVSLIEFWRRWHVSLSHWLRDYLYIPLGGNRGDSFYQTRNLMTTMLLGGLWHGASWTYIIWGGLHGGMLCIHHFLRYPLRRLEITLPAWLAFLLTFHFVTLAWIYFRAPDLAAAHRIIAGLFASSWSGGLAVLQQRGFAVFLLLVFALTHRLDRHALLRYAARHVNPTILWPAIAFCWATAISVSQGSSAKFIYFDF